MSQKRLSMRKIRDVLRLKYGLGRSHREIAAILRISHSTVGSYVRRAREAGTLLAVAGRAGRRKAGGGAVSADATVAGGSAGAGLGAGAPGALAAQGRDARHAHASVGISRRRAGRI